MKQMAADNSLLRMPIIVSGRLLTVGDDFGRIGIMLQLKPIEARELVVK